MLCSPVMDRKPASDYPQELLDLFDKYVHGDIDRRAFLDGAQRFATAGVSAVALWESLKPNYAWAQQVPQEDPRIRAERSTVDSPQGNGKINGYLALPAKGSKWPAILVIHENRGLNPYIEDVARRLAAADFIAFAPDGLTSVGGFPGDNEKGGELFRKVRHRCVLVALEPGHGRPDIGEPRLLLLGDRQVLDQGQGLVQRQLSRHSVTERTKVHAALCAFAMCKDGAQFISRHIASPR